MTFQSVRTRTLHLRRLARAHAAGEMSTLDYRRRRRAFIEASVEAEVAGEVTVPRAVLPARDDGWAARTPSAVGAQGRLHLARFPWFWLMPFSVALLVMLLSDPIG